MGLFKKKKNKEQSAAYDTQKTLHKNLEFTAAEQYKLLRTNLKFTLPEDVVCPVIGMTSSIRGEGKSTTAINMSYSLAEKGGKVLLIDGDLRLPSVANKLGIDGKFGVTNMLMGEQGNWEQFRMKGISDNWYVIPAGEIPPNPSELLGSRRMASFVEGLRSKFDYIVIDLPPVNIVSDAVSISHLLTGMVVVIREEYTEKRELERCMRQLKLSNVNVLGCVMNASGMSGGSYKKYQKYKYYK